MFLSFSKWMFPLGFPATSSPLFSEQELNRTCEDTQYLQVLDQRMSIVTGLFGERLRIFTHAGVPLFFT